MSIRHSLQSGTTFWYVFSLPFHSQATQLPQPLNLTYDHDQLSARSPPLRQSPVLPAPQSRGTGFRSIGGATNGPLRPMESNDGPLQPNLTTTDCNVSVFIAMPTPCKYPPAEFGGEFVIGTAEVMYRHPDRPHP